MYEKYRDRIIIDIGGHDHFTSFRAHKGQTVNEDGTTSEYAFRNLFVAPSITPWYMNNPGISVFEVGDDMVPRNLQQSFLDLDMTIGREDDIPYETLTFRDLDYASEYGLQDLTAQSILKLQGELKADIDLQLKFLVEKMGFTMNHLGEV